MSNPTKPSLAEQIAWARELAAYQRRQYPTLVETGRMTPAMAAHKMALGEAVLDTLARVQSDGPPRESPPQAVRDTAIAGTLFMRFQCGGAIGEHSVVSPGALLRNPRLLDELAQAMTRNIVAVVRAGVAR